MSNKHQFDNSSSIAHCDWHEDHNRMEIKFSSGAVYYYPNCSKDDYEALKAAASPGKHFHSQLRKHKAVKVSG